MSVDFVNSAREALRQGLNIPSLNNVAGASLCIWFRARTVPPGPAPDEDKYALITSSIGPAGFPLSSASRIEIELQSPDGVVANAHNNIVSRALDTDGGSSLSAPDGNITLMKTHFVVVTANYTTAQGKIYLDGVLTFQSTLPNSTPGNTSATNGKVGSLSGEDASADPPADEYFDGQLEDARVYSRELTPDEIQTMWECQGIDGIVRNLEQRYELQDNAVDVEVNDSSASDSAQQQLNASVIRGTPTYFESIFPTYRRRLP